MTCLSSVLLAGFIGMVIGAIVAIGAVELFFRGIVRERRALSEVVPLRDMIDEKQKRERTVLKTEELIELKSVRSSGLMTAYEFVDYLKYARYHVANRIVIEPRTGGLIDVYQYDQEAQGQAPRA